MTDTINWGVLGAAKFAREQMAPAIHAARGARLYGLATSAPEKAAPFRAYCPDLKVYAGYDELLADPEIHAVYIPLPNHLHRTWTLKALDAGKHVLCEKPLCMKAAEFDDIIARRDATGLLAAEAFMIVHHPQWLLAQEKVQDGTIGRLTHVDATFSYDNSGDPGNIRNTPDTGGGSLPDIGVYTIGSARFVTGQEPVAANWADITWENGVDVTARAALRFPGFGLVTTTSMRLAPRQEVIFHGDKGVLRLTAPFNPRVFGEARVVLEQGRERQEWRFPGDSHYVAQGESFGAAIRGDGAFPCPLEFSRGTQAAMDMIFEQARAG